MSYLSQYDALRAADVPSRLQLVNGWLRTDAHPFFAELRERCPIPQTPVFTLVTKYHDVTDILSRDDIFTVRSYAQRIDPTVGKMMLSRDRSAPKLAS
jgi:cytochrome P450